MARAIYFQREAPDPVLPEGTVLSLVRRHIPAAMAVVGVDESGGEARTYAVDADIILKVQRPQQLRTRTSLEREVVFLRHLAAVAPDISVPRVLGYGCEGPTLEYTVLTRMSGSAMRRVTLTPAAKDAVLVDLGRTLRRIHQLPQAPLADSGIFPGDRGLPDVQVRIAEAFSGIEERLRREGRPWGFPMPLEQLATRVAASVPRGEPLVALHSNPGPEHTFVHPEQGGFSGLIDFGDAYISHAAFDLRRWAGLSDREAIWRGYVAEQPVSNGFLAVWRAIQILADASAVAFPGDGAEAAREDLLRLLDEVQPAPQPWPGGMV